MPFDRAHFVHRRSTFSLFSCVRIRNSVLYRLLTNNIRALWRNCVHFWVIQIQSVDIANEKLASQFRALVTSHNTLGIGIHSFDIAFDSIGRPFLERKTITIRDMKFGWWKNGVREKE